MFVIHVKNLKGKILPYYIHNTSSPISNNWDKFIARLEEPQFVPF